jgi:hypothetical protein
MTDPVANSAPGLLWLAVFLTVSRFEPQPFENQTTILPTLPWLRPKTGIVILKEFLSKKPLTIRYDTTPIFLLFGVTLSPKFRQFLALSAQNTSSIHNFTMFEGTLSKMDSFI